MRYPKCTKTKYTKTKCTREKMYTGQRHSSRTASAGCRGGLLSQKPSIMPAGTFCAAGSEGMPPAETRGSEAVCRTKPLSGLAIVSRYLAPSFSAGCRGGLLSQKPSIMPAGTFCAVGSEGMPPAETRGSEAVCGTKPFLGWAMVSRYLAPSFSEGCRGGFLSQKPSIMPAGTFCAAGSEGMPPAETGSEAVCGTKPFLGWAVVSRYLAPSLL